MVGFTPVPVREHVTYLEDYRQDPERRPLSTKASDAGVRPQVLVLPTGGWYEPEHEGENPLELNGNANVLTLDKGSSGFGQGCAAHTCLVRIERFRGQGQIAVMGIAVMSIAVMICL